MSTEIEQVRCLVINLSGVGLLVPSAVVAEITNFSDPEPVHGTAEWMRGMLSWRNAVVPMIDLEQISGQGHTSIAGDPKIMVFYGLQGNPSLQFYAVVVQGVPRAVKVDAEALSSQEGQTGNDLFKAIVTLDGEQLMVPDFSRLEALIAEQVDIRQSA